MIFDYFYYGQGKNRGTGQPVPQGRKIGKIWKAEIGGLDPPEKKGEKVIKVGKRLKMIRKRLGLTQKEFASRIPGGVDHTYVGKVERGYQYPSLKILERVGRAFNVSLGYFFEDNSLTRRKGGKMIKFDEGMRSKQEIIGDLRETPPIGREQRYRLLMLELVADFRDLGKERKDETEALARELLKVKSDIEELKQRLGPG
ncbi:hypothetical protein ES703_37520 [subsurface metagenome]